MSRTQTQGIDFFPLAVDLFSDRKIKILKSRYGNDGIAIYLYILCQIYREGYYTKVDDDFIYIISDELKVSSDKVEQVLTFLLKRSMFDEQLFRSDAVLTCAGIQERWQHAVSARAAKTPIEVTEYWVLDQEKTKPFIKCTNFYNSSKKKDDTSKKKDNTSKNYQQSKVKESIVKESKGKYVGRACATADPPEDDFVYSPEEKQLKKLGGIGKDVVYLTDLQIDDLLEQLGLVGFDEYVKRLAEYILKGNTIKNHYQTILKWYREDNGVK